MITESGVFFPVDSAFFTTQLFISNMILSNNQFFFALLVSSRSFTSYFICYWLLWLLLFSQGFNTAINTAMVDDQADYHS